MSAEVSRKNTQPANELQWTQRQCLQILEEGVKDAQHIIMILNECYECW